MDKQKEVKDRVLSFRVTEEQGKQIDWLLQQLRASGGEVLYQLALRKRQGTKNRTLLLKAKELSTLMCDTLFQIDIV